MLLRWCVPLALIVLSGSLSAQNPQSELNRRQEEQNKAFRDHQRLEQRRDQYFARNVPGHEPEAVYGRRTGLSTTELARRYAADTKPSFVSVTTLAAPKEARKAYTQGLKSSEGAKPNYDEAIRHVRLATEIYPDYAEAWTLLGRIQARINDPGAAAESFQRAIEIDPMFLGPYPDLAYLTAAEKKWPDVVRLGDQMIKINPLFTLGPYYRGLGLLQQAQLDMAEKALLDAQATPDIALFPGVHFMLGEVYRNQSAYPLAAREYRRYQAAVPVGFFAESAQRWIREWEALGVIQATTASN